MTIGSLMVQLSGVVSEEGLILSSIFDVLNRGFFVAKEKKSKKASV